MNDSITLFWRFQLIKLGSCALEALMNDDPGRKHKSTCVGSVRYAKACHVLEQRWKEKDFSFSRTLIRGPWNGEDFRSCGMRNCLVRSDLDASTSSRYIPVGYQGTMPSGRFYNYPLAEIHTRRFTGVFITFTWASWWADCLHLYQWYLEG